MKNSISYLLIILIFAFLFSCSDNGEFKEMKQNPLLLTINDNACYQFRSDEDIILKWNDIENNNQWEIHINGEIYKTLDFANANEDGGTDDTCIEYKIEVADFILDQEYSWYVQAKNYFQYSKSDTGCFIIFDVNAGPVVNISNITDSNSNTLVSEGQDVSKTPIELTGGDININTNINDNGKVEQIKIEIDDNLENEGNIMTLDTVNVSNENGIITLTDIDGGDTYITINEDGTYSICFDPYSLGLDYGTYYIVIITTDDDDNTTTTVIAFTIPDPCETWDNETLTVSIDTNYGLWNELEMTFSQLTGIKEYIIELSGVTTKTITTTDVKTVIDNLAEGTTSYKITAKSNNSECKDKIINDSFDISNPCVSWDAQSFTASANASYGNWDEVEFTMGTLTGIKDYEINLSGAVSKTETTTNNNIIISGLNHGTVNWTVTANPTNSVCSSKVISGSFNIVDPCNSWNIQSFAATADTSYGAWTEVEFTMDSLIGLSEYEITFTGDNTNSTTTSSTTITFTGLNAGTTSYTVTAKSSNASCANKTVTGSFTLANPCLTWDSQSFSASVNTSFGAANEVQVSMDSLTGLSEYEIKFTGTNTNTATTSSTTTTFSGLNAGTTNWTVTAKSSESSCANKTASGSFDLTLPQNEYVWDYVAGGTGEDFARDIETDASGYSYVTGYFTGTVDFHGTAGTKTSNGGTDIFVLKLDPNGTAIWVFTGGGAGNDYAYGIDIDPSGNCYVTGTCAASTDFGGGVRAKNTLFVLKLNTNGSYQWDYAPYAFSGEGAVGYAIAVDGSGNSYTTGKMYASNFKFSSSGSAYTTKFQDVFSLKLDSNGNVIYKYVVVPTNYGEDIAVSTDVDSTGRMFLGGYFKTDYVNFGGGDVARGVFMNMFLVRLNTNGTFNNVYAKASGSQWARVNGIAIDSSNNCYIGGSFLGSNPINFGGGNRTDNAQDQIYIVKLTNNLSYVWDYVPVGTSGSWNTVYDLSVNSSNECFAVGTSRSGVDFGGGAETGPSSFNIFAVKLNASGNYEWEYFLGSNNGGNDDPLDAGGWADDAAYGVGTDGSGNAYIAGSYNGALNFGGGVRTNNGSRDIYVVKLN